MNLRFMLMLRVLCNENLLGRGEPFVPHAAPRLAALWGVGVGGGGQRGWSVVLSDLACPLGQTTDSVDSIDLFMELCRTFD